MKRILTLFACLLCIRGFSQNVGVGTSAPNTRLEVKDTVNTKLKITSKHYFDTSQLIFSNRLNDLLGTDMIMTSNREEGLRVIARSDLPGNNSDSILMITPSGRLGINKTGLPAYTLDVNGDVNTTGILRVNGDQGASGQVLKSNGNGTMTWDDIGDFKNYVIFNYTTAGALQSFAVPAGVTRIKIEAWGGGGYGTNIFISGIETAGAGGGGGGYISGYFDVTALSVINVVVGGGGNVADGTNSRVEFGSPATKTLTANGGTRGFWNGTYFLVGTGGGFSATGTTNYRGVPGENGNPTSSVYEQRTSTDFIQKLLFGNGGNAGNTNYTGGRGGITTTNITTSTILQRVNGTNGSVPGGGGASIGPALGGATGANGMVIIYY
jgi:muconolactone delta-isomerase